MLPPEVIPKRMMGGVGYYLDEKLVLILIESSHTREYKGISYAFEILNGCFFPIEKIKQNTVWAKFNFLENHPIHKNCLYLPAESEAIEEEVKWVLREIKKRNPLFGLVIKESSSEKRIRDEAASDEPVSRKPSLFNTGPVQKKTAVKTIKKEKKVKANKKPENAHLLSILKRKT
jgi:hypothetical protein